MKQQRYEVLKALIEKNTWNIDAKAGTVQGRYGAMGYFDVYGYRRTSGTYEGKVYTFATSEIILASEGYDLTDKEVSFIDEDKANTQLKNLALDEKGVSAKRAMAKSKGVWKRRLTPEIASLIKADLREGLSLRRIAEKHDTNYKAVSRISQGKTFKNVK